MLIASIVTCVYTFLNSDTSLLLDIVNRLMSQSICCEYRVCIAPSPPTSPLPAKTKLFQPTAPSFPSYIFNVFAFAFPLIYSLAPLFPLLFHLLPSPLPLPSPTYLYDSLSCHYVLSYLTN
jgi:hypothetical protein